MYAVFFFVRLCTCYIGVIEGDYRKHGESNWGHRGRSSQARRIKWAIKWNMTCSLGYGGVYRDNTPIS